MCANSDDSVADAQTRLYDKFHNLMSWLNIHLTAVGSSLARVTCKRSQVLPASGQVVFLGDLPFSPQLHVTINAAQNE